MSVPSVEVRAYFGCINPIRPERNALSGEAGSWRGNSHAALIAAAAIFLVNFLLLAASLSDYRVTIDSAYHVSIARQWGEHWIVPWDTINFGPGGRPNLQGPLFQAAIGNLGRMLGGSGADYVMANAIAALAQWAAALLTAAFFALQLGGVWAALFAASLLAGAAFASSSYAIGIPSGWLFILTGWAVWCFVHRRTVWAAILTSLAIYVHVAGFAMAPLAILIAAVLTRRWRELALAGLITATATAPYSIFVVRHAGWFTRAQGYPALLFDPLVDLLGVLGTLMILRRPREHAFMAAWLLGPLVWLTHDPARLILQWALPASVAAGLLLARAMARISRPRRALLFGWTMTAAATFFPLGIPALAPEITWDLGLRYPRGVDWTQSSRLAATIRRAGLMGRLVSGYQPALCPALAVFAPLSCEKGHWIEVQPVPDPADALGVADKIYVLPLPADDTVLAAMQRRRWVTAYGSVESNTVVSIAANPPAAEVAGAMVPIAIGEARWLGHHAVINTIAFDNWADVISSRAQAAREARLRAQRISAGRIELACLLYAGSIEQSHPARARRARWTAREFGVMASFLSDGLAIDYLSQSRLAAFKADLIRLGAQIPASDPGDRSAPVMGELHDAVANALDAHGGLFVERPRGNLLPWLK